MATHTVRPEAPPREHAPVSDLAQWVAVLGGPVAFLLDLQVSYMAVQWACTSGQEWVLHLASGMTLLLAGSASALGLTLWRRLGVDSPGTAGDSSARSRFLALIGALAGALFALVIIAQWVTVMVLGPCMRS